MNIPLGAIETEIPTSYYVKGAKGRMDIVVSGVLENDLIPLMVVECKASDIPLTEEVYNQVDRYAELLNIPFVMVTNGIYADISYWNNELSQYQAIQTYPSYLELCEPEKITNMIFRNTHIQDIHMISYIYLKLLMLNMAQR